jgi:hypothetical protein
MADIMKKRFSEGFEETERIYETEDMIKCE